MKYKVIVRTKDLKIVEEIKCKNIDEALEVFRAKKNVYDNKDYIINLRETGGDTEWMKKQKRKKQLL